jgi:hypothetical protein
MLTNTSDLNKPESTATQQQISGLDEDINTRIDDVYYELNDIKPLK